MLQYSILPFLVSFLVLLTNTLGKWPFLHYNEAEDTHLSATLACKCLKGGLHQKIRNFFLVSNDTMKGTESRKKNFKTMKISVTVKIHPLCTSGSERKFQNGPVGRDLRDITRRQFSKNSTGKLFFLPSGLTTKNKENGFREVL